MRNNKLFTRIVWLKSESYSLAWAAMSVSSDQRSCTVGIGLGILKDALEQLEHFCKIHELIITVLQPVMPKSVVVKITKPYKTKDLAWKALKNSISEWIDIQAEPYLFQEKVDVPSGTIMLIASDTPNVNTRVEFIGLGIICQYLDGYEEQLYRVKILSEDRIISIKAADIISIQASRQF